MSYPIAKLTNTPNHMTYYDYLFKMATMYPSCKVLSVEQWDVLCDVLGNTQMIHHCSTKTAIENINISKGYEEKNLTN